MYSDVRRAEQKLQAAKAGFLEDAVPAGVACCEISEGFPIRYMNDFFVKMLGCRSFSEVTARSGGCLASFFVPEDRKSGFDEILEDMKTLPAGEERTHCFRAAAKEGGRFWLRSRCRNYADGDAPLAFFLCSDAGAAEQCRQDPEIKRLREDERLFRLAAARSNRAVYRYDIPSRTARADAENAAKLGIFEMDEKMPEGVISRGILFPESLDSYTKLFGDIFAGKPEGGAKIRVGAPGGTSRWLDVQYALIDSGKGRPCEAMLSLEDVTETHEKEIVYGRYRQAAGSAAAEEGKMFIEADVTAGVVEKSGGKMLPAWFPPPGSRWGDVIDCVVKHCVAPEDEARYRQVFSPGRLEALFAGGQWDVEDEWRIHSSREGSRWILLKMELARDPYSGHLKSYAVFSDVTAKRDAALRIQKQAETDGMTKLYNKTTTEELIRNRLAQNSGVACALMIVDIDGLKQINDGLGHAFGDKAIRIMAETLRGQFRRSDIVGRVGGDEFMVFLDGTDNEERLYGVFAALLKKLSVSRLDGRSAASLGASIGAALGVVGRDSFESLYQKADRALYHVKRNGKNDYAFYAPGMEDPAYRHKNHAALPRESGSCSRDEFLRLFRAVSAFYPLVISANLTQNSYCMMQCEDCGATVWSGLGVFDSLIANGVETFHPDDRESFVRAFSRENLLAAHSRGEKAVVHLGRQMGDHGAYRWVRTDVIFVADSSGDVMEITLAREIDPEAEEEQAVRPSRQPDLQLRKTERG